MIRSCFTVLVITVFLTGISCRSSTETTSKAEPQPTSESTSPQSATPSGSPVSNIPNLQSELLDDRNKTTTSPIGNADFKNFTYELPRGWENPDGKEITLTNGRVAPVSVNEKVSEKMTDEEKSELKASRRIGLSYVTTKYLDMTGDGQDEAIVILKIETGGSAIPQVAYVFMWKDGKPEVIWPIRTGDRADGGFKDIRVEHGEAVVELYGQDRFLLGQIETGKITGDEEQL
ncbi:MAG: hypothetical protein ABIV21_08545, partial [Pyrinomonadaceae bacterium]